MKKIVAVALLVLVFAPSHSWSEGDRSEGQMLTKMIYCKHNFDVSCVDFFAEVEGYEILKKYLRINCDPLEQALREQPVGSEASFEISAKATELGCLLFYSLRDKTKLAFAQYDQLRYID